MPNNKGLENIVTLNSTHTHAQRAIKKTSDGAIGCFCVSLVKHYFTALAAASAAISTKGILFLG